MTSGDLAISGSGSLAITAKTTGIELTNALTVDSDLHITIKTDCGIDADSVEITGGKTEIYADVDGGDYGYMPYGICAYNDLILTDGNLKVSAEYGYGIDAYSVDISNATFDISAYDDALYAGDTLSIENAEGVLKSDDEDGIHAKDDVTISDATLTIIANEMGMYTNKDKAPVSITDSTVVITAAGRGIYTSKDDSGITISGSNVTITVDNGEYSSDEGIYTKGDESPININNASTVKVTAVDTGIRTKDSDSNIQIGAYESEDTSFVTIITSAEKALDAGNNLYLDGTGIKVVLTSSAEDGDGIECDDFDMTGGWLNNNGNHTFASDFELNEALSVEDACVLHIYENESLTMNALLTNNGTIENNGTLTIPDKNGLAGTGTAGGSGSFRISDFVDADMIVPEDLAYSGEDQTADALAAISLPTTVTIQNAEFTYLDSDGWTLAITPSEVKNAGTYSVVYTRGDNKLEKTFNVAKQDIEIVGAVVSDKMYDGTADAAVSSVTFSGVANGETLVLGEDCLVTAAFPDENADSEAQTITLTVVLTDSAIASNYTLTNGNGFEIENAAKITPGTLTITADDKETYVGSRQPELTYTTEGFIGDDTLTTAPTLTTDAKMNRVGIYTITASGADAGVNYSITYVNGTLTVKNYPYVPSTPTYSPSMDESTGGDVTVTPKNPKQGDTVIITPDPDGGYEVNEVIVTDKNGNPVTVVDNSDGTYSFKQPSGKVNIKVTFKRINMVCPGDRTCPLYPYTDLVWNAWYHDGVHFCIEHGLMQGVGNNQFNPNGTTTRAMIVTILWRLEGSPDMRDAQWFEDVPVGQWYSDAIAWAAFNGIVDGYGNGNFGTNDPITREQFVTIMWRYAKNKGYDVSVGGNTNILSYDDAFDVADWAIPAVQWACGNRMIQGIADGSKMNLAPQGNATRAQAAAILQRFIENVVNED